jgi:hypothetical protein
MDDDCYFRGTWDSERIVSISTGLISRTEAVSERRIEYEYRNAEYEEDILAKC